MSYSFKIKGTADLDASNFINKLKSIEKTMKQLDGVGMPGLRKAYEKLLSRVGEVEEAASRTYSNDAEIKRAKRNISSYSDEWERLQSAMERMDLSRITLDDKELLSQIKAGEAALEAMKAEATRLERELDNLVSSMYGMKKVDFDLDAMKEAAKEGKNIGQRLSKMRNETAGLLKANAKELAEAKEELSVIIDTDPRQLTGKDKIARADAKKEIEGRVHALEKERKELENNYVVLDQIKGVYSSLQHDVGRVRLGDVFKEVSGEAGDALITIQGIEDLLNGLRTEAAEQVADAFSRMTQQMREGSGDLQNVEGAVESIGEQAQEVKRVNTQMDSLRNNMLQFFSLTSGWRIMRRAIKEAYDTVKELDAAMTEIAVVSDYTLNQIWATRREYSDAATEMGSKTLDLIDATKLYVQQGLNLQEAQEVGIETVKMARIANLDGAEATDLMTAAIRGFRLELTEANRINDVYSELAAKSAADTREIATAISKTASIASNAGATFENTAAFLTQIIETTREPAETAGTALKTIIARFQELKKPISEIGEIDGEIVDANRIEAALRTAGIALRDINGDFRDFDDVIIELAAKWDSLEMMTQRYIATMAAGSRQQSRFIALVSDYGRLSEMIGLAEESSGAATEQFNKTLDSLEAKMNILSNSLSLFWTNLADSDLIKAAVQGFTAILDIVNAVVGSFDGIWGTAASIGLMAGVFQVLKFAIEKGFKAIGRQLYEGSVEAGSQVPQGFEDGVRKRSSSSQSEAAKAGRTVALRYYEGYNKELQLMAKKSPTVESMFSSQDSQVQSFVTKNAALMASNYSAALQKEFQKLGDGPRLLGETALETFNQDVVRAEGNYARIGEAHSRLQSTLRKQNINIKIPTDSLKAFEFQLAKINTQAQKLGQGLLALSGFFMLLANSAEKAGKEDTAETLRGIGQASATLGGSLLGLTQIMKMIPTTAGAAAGSVKMLGVTFASAGVAMGAAAVAILAIGAAIWGIATLVKKAKAKTLEGRIKAAEEAANEARETAGETRKAYEELLSGKEEYDGLQIALQELEKGTREWEEALIDVNQKVLEILKTFPELSEFIERGEFGQLVLNEAGYKQYIEKQNKTARKDDVVASANEIEATRLKTQQEKEVFEKLFGVADTYGAVEGVSRTEGGLYYNEGIMKKLIALYEDDPSKLRVEKPSQFYTGEGVPEELQAIFDEMLTTTGAIPEHFYAAIEKLPEYIASREVGEAQESGQKRTLLMTAASTETLAHEYSEEILEALMRSLSEEALEKMKEGEFAEGFIDKVENFRERLDAVLDEDLRRQIAVLLGGGGKGLTRDDLKDDEDVRTTIYNMAKALGFDTAQELTEYLGISYGELINTISKSKSSAKDELKKLDAILKEKGISQDIIESLSPSLLSNLTSQIVDMANRDAQEYIDSFNEVVEESGTSGGAKFELESYLSTVNWKDINSAVDAVTYLQDLGLDPDLIENFWKIGVKGSNAYLHNLEDIDTFTAKLKTAGEEIAEIEDRFTAGEATFKDVERVQKSGLDLTDSLIRTADGWQLSEEAARRASQVLREELAFQSSLVLETQEATYARFKEMAKTGLLSVFVDQEDGVYTGFDWDSLADTNKALIAQDLNVAPKKEGESWEEYWERARMAFENYLFVLNNNDLITTDLQASLDYDRAQSMTALENKLGGGTDQSIIWSAQREATDVGVELDDLKALEEQLINIQGVGRVTAAELASMNSRMNLGLSQVIENYETWAELIDESSGLIQANTADDIKVFNELRESLELMFGTDFSDKFWQDAENIDLIRQAAEGSLEAIGELQKLAALDYLLELKLDDQATADAENAVSNLFDYLNNTELPILETGAKLDDGPFIDALNNILSSSSMTVSEVQRMLGKMGYTADVTYKTVDYEWMEYEHTVGQHGLTATKQSTTLRIPQVRYLSSAGSGGGGVSQANKAAAAKNAPKASKGGGGGKGGGKEDTPWEHSYDWLYNIVQKTNAALRERNKLEKDLDRILKKRETTVDKLYNNLVDQLNVLKQQGVLYKQQESGRHQEIKSLEKRYSDVGEYANYNAELGVVQINWDKINKLSGTKGNQEKGERIDEYIKEIERVAEEIRNIEDALYDIEDQIDAVFEYGRQDYIDFQRRVLDALIDSYQAQIDGFENISNTINESNSKVIDKLQQSVNESRKIRDKIETEDEIEKMENRLAYLRQDTSGGNQLEILQLEEQLADARQNYTDTLIDDKISELQLQNDIAAEQRERQLQIMQAQLDAAVANGTLWGDVKELIDKGVTDQGSLVKGSDLEKLFKEGEGYSALSDVEKMVWLQEVETQAKNMLTYLKVFKTMKPEDFKTTSAVSVSIKMPEIENKVTTNTSAQASASVASSGASKVKTTDKSTTKAETKSTKTVQQARSGKFAPKLSVYKKGGLADFTGPAWLDGTKSDPEMVLNAQDTKNFIELKDTLRSLKQLNQGTSELGGGYYDIRIMVDEISNDYDVDQLAERVQKNLLDASIYRNNNVVGQFRR